MDEGETKGLSERIATRIEKLTKCDCPKKKCYWCNKVSYCVEHGGAQTACYDCSVKFIIEDEEIEEELIKSEDNDWKCPLCSQIIPAKTLTCPTCESYDYDGW